MTMQMGKEADYDGTVSAMANNPRFAADGKLFVRFYMGSKIDKPASVEAGRTMFTNVPYVEIIAPGGKGNIVDRPATPEDKQRFADHFARFEKNAEAVLQGTPLALWPQVGPAEVKELEYFNVYTVEQLAGMSDTAAQNFMGGNDLKAKAQKFIDATAQDAPLNELQTRLERTTQENKVLKGQMNTMAAQMAALAEKVDGIQAAPIVNASDIDAVMDAMDEDEAAEIAEPAEVPLEVEAKADAVEDETKDDDAPQRRRRTKK